MIVVLVNCITISKSKDCFQSSGSGSGLPLLVQRTIAKQIHMVSRNRGLNIFFFFGGGEYEGGEGD